MKQKKITSIHITSISKICKILGDETRLEILWLLLEREMCVSDLANSLDMSASAISHQLRELRITHLVKARKDGKKVYYSLEGEHVHNLLKCMDETILI